MTPDDKIRLQSRYTVVGVEGVASDQVPPAIRELVLDRSSLLALSILKLFNTVGNVKFFLQLVGKGPVPLHEMSTSLLPKKVLPISKSNNLLLHEGPLSLRGGHHTILNSALTSLEIHIFLPSELSRCNVNDRHSEIVECEVYFEPNDVGVHDVVVHFEEKGVYRFYIFIADPHFDYFHLPALSKNHILHLFLVFLRK